MVGSILCAPPPRPDAFPAAKVIENLPRIDVRGVSTYGHPSPGPVSLESLRKGLSTVRQANGVFFEAPCCARIVRHLYEGADGLACRWCLGLDYASRRTARSRPDVRIAKLRARLAVEKKQRRRLRLIARLRKAEAELDARDFARALEVRILNQARRQLRGWSKAARSAGLK